MEPYTLEMDEKKTSANIAVMLLVTSLMGFLAYMLSKTTMTILDFQSATEVKDIEGELK